VTANRKPDPRGEICTAQMDGSKQVIRVIASRITTRWQGLAEIEVHIKRHLPNRIRSHPDGRVKEFFKGPCLRWINTRLINQSRLHIEPKRLTVASKDIINTPGCIGDKIVAH